MRKADPRSRHSNTVLPHRDNAIVFMRSICSISRRDPHAIALGGTRKRLPDVVKGSGVRLSEPLRRTPEQVIEAVSQLGLEGIVAKRKDSRYDAGQRSGTWVKLKLEKQQEFVIGGYRPGNHGVDALLVGYYEAKNLRFAAKVRAGLTPHLRREVFDALKLFHSPKCPFIDLPHTRASRWGGGVTAEQMKEMQWVVPTLVAQIRFVEWTNEGHLRHAAFLGLRSDKAAKDVRRE